MHNLIRYGLTAAIYLIFLFHTTGWVRIGVLDQIENFTYDARVRLTLPNVKDDRIVIVDIDETSLAAEGWWPWSRDKLGLMTSTLFDHYGIAAMGYDVLFAEPERSPDLGLIEQLGQTPLGETDWGRENFPRLRREADRDSRFAESLRGRRVVMGFVFKGEADDRTTTGSLPDPLFDAGTTAANPADYVEATAYTGIIEVLHEAAMTAGFFDNPTLDPDGVFRRVPLLRKYEGQVYGSLALQLMRLAVGNPDVELVYDGPNRTPLNLEGIRIGDFFTPTDEQITVLVPYRGPQRSFPYISATDVLHKRADRAQLKDKLVLVGTTVPGLLDLRTTPVGTVFPGVEVHANIVSGLLDGDIKQRAPYVRGIEATLLLLIALLLTWAFPRLRPLYGTVLVLATLAFIGGLGLLLWSEADFVIPIGTPMAFTLLLMLVQITYSYFVESREKREISERFGQYVPPEIVDQLADHPEFRGMESDSREMTVLFSDVRSFTTISERFEPKELTDLMNQFLTPLTQVIYEHHGTIDKYMGDAIMAFWGAPLPEPGHARRALEAAQAMLKRMAEVNKEFAARGWPELRMGIGLNTGQMSVGNMGSQYRMAYTVLGDAVNLGSRLEGLTKEYGVEIIVSDSTRKAVDGVIYRELDRVRVKGKQEPVGIFEPVGASGALSNDEKQELSHYRQALQAFRAQQWDQAEALLFGLQQAGNKRKIYEIYMSRIAHYRANPPGPNWDGVFTHTTK